MNGVMTMVKYIFVTLAALLFEYFVLAIYNGIAQQYSYPALSGGILAITMPITVIILIWIGYKEMTGDYSDYESGNSY